MTTGRAPSPVSGRRSLHRRAPPAARAADRIARTSSDPAATHSLSPAAIDRFHREGYLSVRGITDAADVARLRGTAIDLFARRAGEREGGFFDFLGRSERGEAPGLQQILDPRSHAGRLTRSRFYAAATAVARSLLGPEARFAADHILCKPALHGAVTPWHQDEAFRDPRLFVREISVWLPLQPVGSENGCLAFIPGSNLGPVLRHRPAGGDRRAHGLECDAELDPSRAVSCPLDIGDCTVHGGRTLHGAGANLSPEPRYAYVLVFELPPRLVADPPDFAWLRQRDPEPARRRRAWMRRGGLAIHVGRRFRQMHLIGPAMLAARLWRKLRFRLGRRGPPGA